MIRIWDVERQREGYRTYVDYLYSRAPLMSGADWQFRRELMDGWRADIVAMEVEAAANERRQIRHWALQTINLLIVGVAQYNPAVAWPEFLRPRSIPADEWPNYSDRRALRPFKTDPKFTPVGLTVNVKRTRDDQTDNWPIV